MYPTIRCFTCNKNIGKLYNLFMELKNKKYKIIMEKNKNTKPHPDNMDDLNEYVDLLDIFEALDIKLMCCRSTMNTQFFMNDLLK